MVKVWISSLSDQEQDKDAIFATYMQHCTGSSNQTNYARKKVKGIQIQNEKVKLYLQMTQSFMQKIF